jgi:hypothetical protein
MAKAASTNKEFPMLYGIDDWRSMNAADMLNRSMDRTRERSGIRRVARNTDVNAFLASFGVKGKRA